jgi:glyoxylase-like metal-dependent hydrolase (beta-lactamase superfamily II)
MKPQIKEFFDRATSTLSYAVYDPATKDAVILDPVWDYDPASSALTLQSAAAIEKFVRDHELRVHFILETHAHADHISSSQWLKNRFKGARIGIGSRIARVQSVFKGIFNLPADFPEDGRQFDFLLEEGVPLLAGSLRIETIFTPGHTPACASYIIGDAVFTGDALFMPDYGTGRCDFPGGSASDLYTSVHDKLYELPDETRVFTCHDYQPGGRALRWESTIGEQKRANIQLSMKTTRAEFIKFRTEKDATLAAPRLLLPSIQVNIAGGRLPTAESNGVRYLKIPLRLDREQE